MLVASTNTTSLILNRCLIRSSCYMAFAKTRPAALLYLVGVVVSLARRGLCPLPAIFRDLIGKLSPLRPNVGET